MTVPRARRNAAGFPVQVDVTLAAREKDDDPPLCGAVRTERKTSFHASPIERPANGRAFLCLKGQLYSAASACWLTQVSANSLRATSVFSSSLRVALRSFAPSLLPSSSAQVASVP